MTNQDGGKGSKPRPLSISQDDYSARWNAIFNRAQRPKPHAFLHDGWGQYHCRVCGKNEKYANAGEQCQGEAA